MANDPESSEDAQLVLGDGRRLGYAQYGQPDGEPIMYFHGHPGSRLEARLAHEAAGAAGFRVIALDRPGYGLSDFRPRTGWAMGNAGIVRELLRFARVRAGDDPRYAVTWPDHPQVTGRADLI